MDTLQKILSPAYKFLRYKSHDLSACPYHLILNQVKYLLKCPLYLSVLIANDSQNLRVIRTKQPMEIHQTYLLLPNNNGKGGLGTTGKCNLPQQTTNFNE